MLAQVIFPTPYPTTRETHATAHFTDDRLLPSYASITFKYSQHRTKRQDVAMPIKGRSVQARSAASVKEQGIGATQPATE